MKRCDCGRRAVTFRPGSDATRAPGGIVIERGKPAKAWCQRCAEARGWLVAPASHGIHARSHDNSHDRRRPSS